jgi:hypothetical protein
MLLSLRGTIAIDERMGRGMETNESLQRENCKTYYLVLYLSLCQRFFWAGI